MLEIKLQSQTKTKRLRVQPKNFAELHEVVESQIREERNAEFKRIKEVAASSQLVIKDFTIKYLDEDNEQINVSDDDDLFMAYKHA